MGIDVHIVEYASEPEFQFVDLPDTRYRAMFTVSTLRKKYYYAVSSREEALTWVNSLRHARQETITRKMGHSGNMPYPKSWEQFDGLGRDLVRSKDRIRHKMEQTQFKEMDMATFSGDGGPMPSGYYG